MNNFSGTLIDGLQTLRESRIENRESKDGRHNKDSTRAGCRLFTNECRQWSKQSTIEQIRFWPGAFSFTVFHANKTSEDIFNKLQSKNTKAFIMFSCQMHGLASCGDWVIAEKNHALTTVPKAFIFHCPKHGIGFFLRGCPMHTLGRKTAKGCSKDNAKMLHRSF